MLEKTALAFDEVDRKRREFFSLGLEGNSQVMKYFKPEKTVWPEEYETLYDEAIPILDHLKASGYRLGMIANQGSGLKERLEKWNLSKYFSVIASSSDLGYSKPDTRLFEKALKLSGFCDDRG